MNQSLIHILSSHVCNVELNCLKCPSLYRVYTTEQAVTGITADESIADSEVQNIDLQHQQPELEEPAQVTESVIDDG